MRGLIMAGGTGSRLYPLTKTINKHLLPIFDKPLIYYPLSTLMLAGVREVCLVSSPADLPFFEKLLGDGTELGMSIIYIPQNEPKGIANGFTLAAGFLAKHKVALILGDNLFHGKSLGRHLAQFKNVNGAQLFAYKVRNPQDYGVVEMNINGDILSLEEKPVKPKSNLAVTGLYFYDEDVVDISQSLIPSGRGELEITDLNKEYFKLGKLNVNTLSSGTTWLDAGTFENLHDASSYIRIIQDRQSFKIGEPIEVAKSLGWI
jgi:glucose-1-phosphate thymidylyltransferase